MDKGNRYKLSVNCHLHKVIFLLHINTFNVVDLSSYKHSCHQMNAGRRTRSLPGSEVTDVIEVADLGRRSAEVGP